MRHISGVFWDGIRRTSAMAGRQWQVAMPFVAYAPYLSDEMGN